MWGARLAANSEMPYKNPEAQKARDRAHHKAYYGKHKERILARMREYYSKHPDKLKVIARKKNLRRKYGITLEDYQEMWDAQKGLCAICNSPETWVDPRTGRIAWLSVDHDHRSEKVRELLCKSCNTGLARFLDSPETLRAAAVYLEKHANAYAALKPE